MVAIGFGLAWLSYTGLIWGVSLVRGWDISLAQIASPGHPYDGKWPPPIAPNTTVFPDGAGPAKSTTVAKKTGGKGKPGTVTPGGGGGSGPPEVAV